MKMKLFLLFVLATGVAHAQRYTAGPAVAATSSTPAWLPTVAPVCSGYQQAAPVTAVINTLQLTGVIPPQSVLQNEMYGTNMACTVTGLTAGASYNLTWVGAEMYWTGCNVRVIGLSANGVSVFNGLDMFCITGGQNIAIQRSAVVAADSKGTITMTFSQTLDAAKFDAIYLTPVVPPIPMATTSSVDANGTTTIIIPIAATLPLGGGACSVTSSGNLYVLFCTAPAAPAAPAIVAQ